MLLPFFLPLLLIRPGCCAGTPYAERFKVSNEFPDDTLNFIKMHPLMDEAVPSIANRPWFLKTMVRWELAWHQQSTINETQRWFFNSCWIFIRFVRPNRFWFWSSQLIVNRVYELLLLLVYCIDRLIVFLFLQLPRSLDVATSDRHLHYWFGVVWRRFYSVSGYLDFVLIYWM